MDRVPFAFVSHLFRPAPRRNDFLATTPGGLDLLEIQKPTPAANHRNQVTAAHHDGHYRRARPSRYEKVPLHDQRPVRDPRFTEPRSLPTGKGISHVDHCR
jgi:hypothetical protein